MKKWIVGLLILACGLADAQLEGNTHKRKNYKFGGGYGNTGGWLEHDGDIKTNGNIEADGYLDVGGDIDSGGDLDIVGTLDVGGILTVGSGIFSSATANMIIKNEPAATSIIRIDANPLDGSSGSSLRIGRLVTTSGTVETVGFKGDGTNTQTWVFNHVLGSLQLDGDIDIDGGDATLGATSGRIGPRTNPNQLNFVDSGTTEQEGDWFWVGEGSGPPYGHMSIFMGNLNVSISTQNQWEEITATLVGGETNLITFQNNHEMLVIKAGRYKIVWSTSLSITGGTNIGLMAGVTINSADDGVAVGSSSTYIKASAGSATFASIISMETLSGSVICDLAASDRLSLCVLNQSSIDNIIVKHVTFTVSMAGGT